MNPGTDNDIPSAAKWWLLQVNKPHASSRDRSGCQIFGFGLNEHTSDKSTSAKHFTLLPDSVKVYFGSIIKHNKIPVVAPAKAKPTSSTALGSQPNCLEFHDHADGNTEETLITDINYHYLIMSSDSGCKSDIYFNLHVAYKAYLLSYWLSI